MRVLSVILVLSISLLLTACADGPFGEAKVRELVESGTMKLSGEQVMLSEDQFNCGVRAELWEVEKLGPVRSVGRLTQKARDMKFDDDVQIGDRDMRSPYAQIRGDFSIVLVEVTGIRDENAKTKLVDAKLGARFDHSCFAWLPLMGVRHGQFNQDALPKLEFRMAGDWEFAGIQH
jgi:hypothetical protein